MDAWVTGAQVKERPDTGALSDANATTAGLIASNVLWGLSGRQYGIKTRTIRPEGCGRRSESWSADQVVGWGMALPLAAFLGPWPLPGPAGGMIAPCGGCGRYSTQAIDLPGPVAWDSDHPIVITVNGSVLDASKWSMWGADRILRTDGGVFPQCQDLRVATTEAGTLAVQFCQGVPAPPAGLEAAKSLAVELARLYKWLPGQECRLPQRVRTIVRQGVTAGAIIDPLDVLQKGGTGLSDVDMFLRSVNPKATFGGASIITPGLGDDDRSPSVIPGTAGAFS